MRMLLSFAGFHDPHSLGLVGEEEQPGPILSLANEFPFDRVVLFFTPPTSQNAIATQEALRRHHPATSAETREIPINDPTDYVSILKGLRGHFEELIDSTGKTQYFVSVASGTPQMHACWVLLVASGEIPAKILHVRPPKFVTKERPMVSEVDLTRPDFPVVRSNVCSVDLPETAPLEIEAAICQLGIVGDHPAMKKVLETAGAMAGSDCPVLILGETGTGKELLARFIHRVSERANGPFVPLNCAAIPSELAESILFGHRKGAFTGASDQTGKFTLADGGTLFLDELGELPLAVQAKLLRVLQDGRVESLGDKKARQVNVRVVAATNSDLSTAVRQKQFRKDLYYRLNVGHLTLPALRERRTDIPKIALHILDLLNKRLKKPKRLSPEALTRLQRHAWEGNVRDLANVIERSARLTRNDVLESDDLLIEEGSIGRDSLDAIPEPYEGFSMEDYLGSVRKQLILRALDTTKGNQSEAGRLLGISAQAVNKFLQKR